MNLIFQNEMNIDNIISAITGYSYDELNKTVPEDIDRDQIVRNYEEIINESLSNVDANVNPSLVNVSGIPGSGKSTFCKKLMEIPKYYDAIYIGFDKIMEDKRLPYADEESNDPQEAFKRWEISARIAGYELLKRAIKNKLPIVFDHSSAIPQHIDLFKLLLAIGYEVHFFYISIDEDEAKRRVMNRKRHVPPIYIEERSNALRQLLSEYKKICTSYKKIEQ